MTEERKPLIIALLVVAAVASMFIPMQLGGRLVEKYDREKNQIANITLVAKTEDTAVFEYPAPSRDYYFRASVALPDVEVGSHGYVANSSGVQIDGSYEHDQAFIFAQRGSLFQWLIGYYRPPAQGHIEGMVEDPTSVSAFEYTNEGLGIAAGFPDKPSETQERQKTTGGTFTSLYVRGGVGSEETQLLVQCVEPTPKKYRVLLADQSDEDRKEALGSNLVNYHRFISGNAEKPPIRFGRIGGNRSATAVFTDGSGREGEWYYCTSVIRGDGRIITLSGVRSTKGDAISAAESLRFFAPKPTSAKSQMPDGAVKWSEAGEHVGEEVTVYGPVVGSKYAEDANSHPTFLNIGAPYGDSRRVTVVIWGEDRDAFSGSPEETYLGQTISVTGKAEVYDGAISIEVKSPSQVRVLE